MGQMKWAIRDTQLCNLNHTSCKVGARDVAKTRALLYFLRLLYSLTFDTDNCDVKIHMVEPFFSLKAHKVKNEKFLQPSKIEWHKRIQFQMYHHMVDGSIGGSFIQTIM